MGKPNEFASSPLFRVTLASEPGATSMVFVSAHNVEEAARIVRATHCKKSYSVRTDVRSIEYMGQSVCARCNPDL